MSSRAESDPGPISQGTPQAGAAPAAHAPWVQASSMQLGLAMGLVGIVFYRIDLATQRIQLNDWGYQFIGLEPQPDGMPIEAIRERIHPDDRQMIRDATRHAAETTGVIDTEARYRRFDGVYRTLLTRRLAERNAAGEAVAVIGVSMDISEQVKEREKAQAAAQSMEMVVDATGVGVWSTDVASRQTQWNTQMRRIYGIADDVPVWEARRQAIARTDPADVERLDAAYARLAAGEQGTIEIEFGIRWPDGQPRWIVGRSRAAVREGRRVVFGVFIDVTERRTTQERLRRAEERTLLAAKTVGLAMWERDLVTGESWWDAQMYRLRGLSSEERRTPNELRHQSIHPDDLYFVEERTAHIIDRETDYQFDFRVRWPNGTVRWLAARGTVIRDDAGRPLRILGFNWDVTEHKNAEALRHEREAAEEASRAKSQFLSRMSHELRTPLNAVLGFTQVMLDDASQPLGDRQRPRAEHIRDAGKHLLALIDDVLDLTSVEAVGLNAEPLAVAPLVSDMVMWITPAADTALVSVDTGALHGAVMADQRRLRQVLGNLLSNAVKYNRVGGRVLVSAHAGQGRDAGMLCIRVEDSGRGLTPAQLQRLFEPFNRLGVEREGIEGTGIGLTIVRSLVERMGGRVDVRSDAGKGTCFEVWLPAAKAPQDSEATQPMPLTVSSPGLSAIEVLYIEDNAVNVLLLREIVNLRDNVTLHVAVDGRSGIERALALKPRAVLIDLQLPDIDGFAVLQALRQEPSMKHVALIALSANAMPDDIERAMQLGFDDYLTKPIDFRRFLGTLDNLAGLSSG
ncbi:hybrid sensor histidine kinase/response regulator [Piscinibacter terrae]|uniref:histidine kinase n=1 Tax=Piscinibacter terrae TaxID=2496871 RepID=A0A3N7K2L5_9BURK|nr:PAS domain-containing hybrid sensor histidine kinase/response regulator [Albitalea terrae]RQP25175.1 PAS domain S-box protein [Albitalea terrae]